MLDEREFEPLLSVDYDLNGVVGVRLLGPTAKDVLTVDRQIGALRKPLARAPDLAVRFVDSLNTRGLHWIEFGRTGSRGNDFFVLQGGKAARVDFAAIGEPGFEILCERGAPQVPLLMALVNLAALRRDVVPLHASGFRYGDTGVLVAGWAKGGKTEALLAFARRGAEYLGDEWIWISPDGRRMYGIPEFIRLQEWHLAELPAVRARVPRVEKLLFRTIRSVAAAHEVLSNSPLARLRAMKHFGRAVPALRRQLNVQLDPCDIFGTPRAFAGPLDMVFLMISHLEGTLEVEPIDVQHVCRRMAASVAYEQLPLTKTYLAYRFAFPERRSAFLDQVPALQAELLSRALAGKDSYVVRHPYPCDLDALFRAMLPIVDPAGVRGASDAARASGAVGPFLVPSATGDALPNQAGSDGLRRA